VILRYPAPIETAIENFRWSFAEHLYEQRCAGATYAELAQANNIHRSTARDYARAFEWAGHRYGWLEDQATSCNQLGIACSVCGEKFTASRGDARYCSNACRQDAYRKRKEGAA
jgi:hypothetical protein